MGTQLVAGGVPDGGLAAGIVDDGQAAGGGWCGSRVIADGDDSWRCGWLL